MTTSEGTMPSQRSAALPAQTPRLRVEHASKTFGGKRVLSDFSFTVAPGEIHGLVGQNGSGKSTVLKLLSGFHSSDPGSAFFVDGEPLGPPVSPDRLRDLGVSFVHQDLGLDERSSVTDNVRLGRYRAGRFSRGIHIAEERETVGLTLARLGAGFSPTAIVGSLSLPERAVVAIARALQGHEPGKGLIVFDESTQSLPRDTLADFYAIVRDLAAEGTGVLIVSHRLDEILALTDNISVLRDGSLVETVATREVSELALTQLMLGREADTTAMHDQLPTSRGEEVLRVSDVTSGGLEGLSFSVCGGEVVGITGTPESGYDEIPYVIAGARTGAKGTVSVTGRSYALAGASPRDAMGAGLALIPQSRHSEGLAMGMTLLENLTAPRIRARSGRWAMKRQWQDEEFGAVVKDLGITPAQPNLAAAALSGGNQQKLLLGKWLVGEPAALVAHEPTQAVDVGARRDILKALRTRAQGGTAVVVVSVETQDLAAVCDRILIMSGGTVVHELIAPFTSADILSATYLGQLPAPLTQRSTEVHS